MLLLKDESFNREEILRYMDLIENDGGDINTYKLSDDIPEVKVVPWFGILLIYSKEYDLHHIKRVLSENNDENKDETPNSRRYSYTYNDIVPFGNMQIKSYKKKRIIIDLEDFSILQNQIRDERSFTWFIKIINKSKTGYLTYNYSNELYLVSAASTIIYDLCDLFKSPVKQLDFPYLNQYSCDNILNTSLLIPEHRTRSINFRIHQNSRARNDAYLQAYTDSNSAHELVTLNIIYHYLKIYKKQHFKSFIHHEYEINPRLSRYSFKNYNRLPPITDKEFFSDKKCFISEGPLFGIISEYKILYKKDNKNCSETVYLNTFFDYISGFMRCSSVIKYKDRHVTATSYINHIFKIKYGVKKVESAFIKKHYLDNIVETINDMKVEQNYKNLLSGILEYGLYMNIEPSDNICLRKNRYCISCYVINTNTNQIFIGKQNLSDTDILHKKDSSNVLFSIEE